MSIRLEGSGETKSQKEKNGSTLSSRYGEVSVLKLQCPALRVGKTCVISGLPYGNCWQILTFSMEHTVGRQQNTHNHQRLYQVKDMLKMVKPLYFHSDMRSWD